MNIPIYQVDAFSSRVFGGNPAAVCPLECWLPDDLMLKIARENGVAETAFFVGVGDGYEIRWFTPEIEMDLCGHATLAAAHVLWRHLLAPQVALQFFSSSGPLVVTLDDPLITLDFPAREAVAATAPAVILEAIGTHPVEVLKARDYLLVFENEDTIRALKPNQSILDQINLDPGGVVVTAPGNEIDFVSRYFTPQASIFEDPVTGSAHCSLIPYWSKRLGKENLVAWQVSARGGRLVCKDMGERVLISGEAVTSLVGQISIYG